MFPHDGDKVVEIFISVTRHTLLVLVHRHRALLLPSVLHLLESLPGLVLRQEAELVFLGVSSLVVGSLLLDPDVERVQLNTRPRYGSVGHGEEAGNVGVAVTVNISNVLGITLKRKSSMNPSLF